MKKNQAVIGSDKAGLFYMGMSGNATLVREHLNGGLNEVREEATDNRGKQSRQREQQKQRP